MAKTGSFIKLDRGLKTNPLWLERPFSRGQAWVDLLLLAQGVDKEKMYRGKVQNQKPGVVYTSILFLTKRWGWSRQKVYRFLEELMKDKMVVVQGWTQNGTQKRTRNETNNGTTNGTIVSIVNWAVYQHRDTNNGTKNETVNETKDETINETHNRKHTEKAYIESNKRIPPKSPKGDLTPSEPKRGTDAFRNKSHLLLKRDEGTVDDIPVVYRDRFDNFPDYHDWRNQ